MQRTLYMRGREKREPIDWRVFWGDQVRGGRERPNCCVKRYGVATISRLLKIVSLFCKKALQKRHIFCKESYNFREPTNRSHHSMKECLGTALALCCSVVQCIAV